MIPDANGIAHVALVNDELELGVAISYPVDELPCFTQWKMLSQGEYVIGLEPGNANPIGRVEARNSNRLAFLNPGEGKNTKVEISILDGADEIIKFEDMLKINEGNGGRYNGGRKYES